jgi:hypothetical protein
MFTDKDFGPPCDWSYVNGCCDCCVPLPSADSPPIGGKSEGILASIEVAPGESIIGISGAFFFQKFNIPIIHLFYKTLSTPVTIYFRTLLKVFLLLYNGEKDLSRITANGSKY